MIFVTVGSSELPFDRLLQEVGRLPTDEPLVVQHGPSKIPPSNATCIEFMSFSDVIEYMRAARVVIAHAGAGSAMAALSVNKRPVVLPRRRRFGEAVDDHQVELARRLDDSGLVTMVENADGIVAALQGGQVVSPRVQGKTGLAAELRAYLSSCCAERAERDRSAP
jgi:UDP-N-acetylglucosamine transferase subunit ALG13